MRYFRGTRFHKIIASPASLPAVAILHTIPVRKPLNTRQFYSIVYIMTNNRNTVLYTGVTNNIRKRVYEHRQRLVKGFTKKYNLIKLVYYESFGDSISAIKREKQIKAGSRKKKKENLINNVNGKWQDLYEALSDCFARLRLVRSDFFMRLLGRCRVCPKKRL